jgi:hypothetical protein
MAAAGSNLASSADALVGLRLLQLTRRGGREAADAFRCGVDRPARLAAGLFLAPVEFGCFGLRAHPAGWGRPLWILARRRPQRLALQDDPPGTPQGLCNNRAGGETRG